MRKYSKDNVKINIKTNYMSMCNEDNKLKKKRLYKKKKDLYVNRRTALSPIELNRP